MAAPHVKRRRRLAWLEKQKEQAKQTVETATKKVVEEIKETVDDIVEETKETVEEIKETVSDIVEETKEAVEEIKEKKTTRKRTRKSKK